ncbi:hypothetical protein A3H80_03945 [Candidatus Roizmanbacteria bacterium RIFCSPLOWO2_02_FULL_37_19]|nr:MAG: hypothetical protein A3H80_03945 [Candidatus Roizmanbacteria bacterium RIFCSPLOWO2_02_FULL_37_19]
MIIRHNASSGTLTDGLQIQNTTAGGTITNGINIVETAGTITTGLNIGSGVGTAIALQNGETIDNTTDNQINLNLGSSGSLMLTSSTESKIANSAGNLTMDIVGDIYLDADGGDLIFNDNGSTVATFTNSSTDLIIDAVGNDVTSSDQFTIGNQTAGVAQLTVTGDAGGNALTILNDTGSQNILVASSSGSMVYGITTDGDVTQGNNTSALDVHGDQYSLAPNASFEINSDGDTTLPDAWFVKGAGSPLWVNAGIPVHGDNYLELSNYLDEAMSACFPIAQETAGGVNRTYTMSLWYGSNYLGISNVLRFGLYTYTSRSNCESDSTGAPLIIALNPGNASKWSYSGNNTVTPADTYNWARAWVANNDSTDVTTINIDGILVLPTNITSGLDIAETYPVDPSGKPEIAQLVSMGTTPVEGADIPGVIKTSQAYDKNLFGVVSTQPGQVLDDGNAYEKAQIALKGRVPVLVTTENGPINIGDPITSSSIPGVGMKATRAGRIIGYAMTTWTSTDPHEIDQVIVFVNPGFNDPHATEIAEKYDGKLEQEQSSMLDSLTTLANEARIVISEDGKKIAKLAVDSLEATSINVETALIKTAHIVNATIDTLIVDRIVGTEIDAQKITATKINAEDIDATSITTDSLIAQDATISGKLVADEVDSENIREFRNRLEKAVEDQTILADKDSQLAITDEQLSASSSQLQSEIKEIQQYIDELNQGTSEAVSATTTFQQINTDINVDPGVAINAESLMVTGHANLYTANVAESLTAGNLFMQDSEVIALTNELKLSALETVNILDGAVVIARNGSMTVKGEIIAQGGVRTNEIRAIEDDKDIDVVLNSGTNGDEILKSQISILNSQTGQSVASIDASGSARFANLSLDKYNQATSSGVVIAARENFERYGIFAPAIETNAASTGNGILPKLYQEILIYSDKVTEDSLIYVTPTSSTGNRQLYVSDKVGCNPEDDNTPCKPYFKVTIDSASLQDDITFNWWIVN